MPTVQAYNGEVKQRCQRAYDTLYGAVIGSDRLSAEKELLLRHLSTLYSTLLEILDGLVQAADTLAISKEKAAESASTVPASGSSPTEEGEFGRPTGCPQCYSRLVRYNEGKKVCGSCGVELV